MYVEKTKTWDDRWNDVIRDVIYPDEKLKELMLIPDKTSILEFITRFFIKNAATSELLIDEKVRVVYHDSMGSVTGNKNVRNKQKEFDIYVKDDYEFNACEDRLKGRDILIMERLKYLLLQKYHICGLHFAYYDDYDLWTKAIGYKRYHIAFSYKISV